MACLCFPGFFSVDAFAASASPDALSSWYLLPYSALYSNYVTVDGAYSASDGSYSAPAGTSITGFEQWTGLRAGSGSLDGVFPFLSRGHTYRFYFTFTSTFDFSNQFLQAGFRISDSDPSTMFLLDIDSTSYTSGNLSNGTHVYTLSAMMSYTPSSDIALSSSSGFYFGLGVGGATVGNMSWALYCVDGLALESSSPPATVAGQQAMRDSINSAADQAHNDASSQLQQDKDQYDEFTQGGDGSEFNSATDQVSGKIGIFTALDNLLQGIFGIFTSGTADAATIVWPSFALTVEGQSYDVWPEQTINLDTMFSGPLSALKVALNFASVSAVYFALVRYLLHVYDAIFGRGDA